MKPFIVVILFVTATCLPTRALADRDPEVHQGEFVKLDKLEIKTADGYPTLFILRNNGRETLSFCIDDRTSTTKALLQKPSNFIGRKCVVRTTIEERQLVEEFEYVDLVFVSAIKWLD